MNTHRYRFQHEQSTHDSSPFAVSGFPVYSEETKAVNYNEAPQWMYVVDEFLDFLSGVYGYNLKERIEYKDATIIQFDHKDVL